MVARLAIAAAAAVAAATVVAMAATPPTAATAWTDAACGTLPQRDAAALATVGACTADPAACCVSSNLFSAPTGGCCYWVSGRTPRGVRLVPFTCAGGIIAPAPAGDCLCSYGPTIG